MSNEKQAQELTGNEWEVLSAPATHKTDATQYAIMRREGLVCGFTANNSDTEAPERAALIASAPSLKAENERLREANRVMLEALKQSQDFIGAQILSNESRQAYKANKAAISIGEGREGVTTEPEFIVEIEKGIDWNNGYLSWDGKVVSDIKEAQTFADKTEAEEAASMFNIEYGIGGKIYARVR